MLMRFEPLAEVGRLAHRWAQAPQAAIPMDAYRQGERFVVHLDLPGVDPASVELTIDKNVLKVSAQRQTAEAEDREWLVNERPHGSVSRQLFLAEGLDLGRIEANYDRGVLTVAVPVAEAAKARKVQISAGNAAKAIEATTGEA